MRENELQQDTKAFVVILMTMGVKLLIYIVDVYTPKVFVFLKFKFVEAINVSTITCDEIMYMFLLDTNMLQWT